MTTAGNTLSETLPAEDLGGLGTSDHAVGQCLTGDHGDEVPLW
jgi:hypothetical protein